MGKINLHHGFTLSLLIHLGACRRGPYCWGFTPLFNYEVTGMVFGASFSLCDAANTHTAACDPAAA